MEYTKWQPSCPAKTNLFTYPHVPDHGTYEFRYEGRNRGCLKWPMQIRRDAKGKKRWESACEKVDREVLGNVKGIGKDVKAEYIQQWSYRKVC